MIYDEPPCAWRFVDDPQKLSVTCSNCDQEKYDVHTDTSLLPPFIWSGTSFFTPQSFWLRTLDGGSDINLASYLSDLHAFSIGSKVYVAFHGQSFTPSISDLSEGLYQCQISDGINTIYSEPLRVCSELTHCIRLQWTNSCDLAGIPYTYLATLPGGVFRNVMFVEKTPILQAEYETDKEENVNMLRQVTVLYQSQERTLRFKTYGPHWIVRMFKAIELHNDVDIFININSDTGYFTYESDDVQDVEVVISDLESSECTQEIEFKFKQDDAIISGICCANETPEDCLEPCYSVLGFYPEGECIESAFYIDDIDSGVIVQCVNGAPVVVSTTCVYVSNEADGNYYYFNGDFWTITPELDFVSILNLSMTQAQVNLIGFTIPGTWVYVYYSCNNVTFTQYPTPFTAAQLASGISITIPRCNDSYYFYCTSQNHTCTYDNSDTIVITPD